MSVLWRELVVGHIAYRFYGFSYVLYFFLKGHYCKMIPETANVYLPEAQHLFCWYSITTQFHAILPGNRNIKPINSCHAIWLAKPMWNHIFSRPLFVCNLINCLDHRKDEEEIGRNVLFNSSSITDLRLPPVNEQGEFYTP